MAQNSCYVDIIVLKLNGVNENLEEVLKLLTLHELERYKRNIEIDGWGIAGQEKLKNTTVFVAGAGGSGSPILTQLALLGIGHIIICDDDMFEVTNMNRQFIHEISSESRIGMNKAVSAKKTIECINPNIKVDVYTDRITSENIYDMVGKSELLFDCVDNFETKFILSECAVNKGIPHMFGGMFDINAFACIFAPPLTPCFHCLFDYKKLTTLKKIQKNISQNRGTVQIKSMTIPVCAPTLFTSTGFLVGESIKILLGIGEPNYNKYTLILQKASEGIAKTKGYQGVRFWNNKFFDEISLKQGFDWDIGWRGQVFEQLLLSSNPECICCSNKAHH